MSMRLSLQKTVFLDTNQYYDLPCAQTNNLQITSPSLKTTEYSSLDQKEVLHVRVSLTRRWLSRLHGNWLLSMKIHHQSMALPTNFGQIR